MKNLASPTQRIFGYLADAFICVTPAVLLINWALSSTSPDELIRRLLSVVTIMLLFYSLLIPLFYAYLIHSLGATPGKLLVGTKVVDSDGKLISFGRAFFRNQIGYMVSGLLFGLGFIWIAVDKDRRGWHDQIADTFVISTFKLGSLIGLMSIVILAVFNLFLFNQAISFSQNHLPWIKQTIEEIQKENQTPTPREINSPTEPQTYYSTTSSPIS